MMMGASPALPQYDWAVMLTFCGVMAEPPPPLALGGVDHGSGVRKQDRAVHGAEVTVDEGRQDDRGMAVEQELAQGRDRILLGKLAGVGDHLAEALDQLLDPPGMDAVFGLFKADQAPVPRVVQEGQQGQHPQGAVGDDTGAERHAIPHRELDPVLSARIMKRRIQAADSRDQIVQFGADVEQHAGGARLARRLGLELGEHRREV